MKPESNYAKCHSVDGCVQVQELQDTIKRKRMDNTDCKLWYNKEEIPKDVSIFIWHAIY